MAYIILTAHSEELDRRKLTEGLTIGRGPACDIVVHDILMSRAHCRIEQCPRTKRWKIIDLGSKNGTHYNWTRVTDQVLFEGDSFRIGRTWLTYHAGKYVPPAAGTVRKSKLVRPADPHEALSGTVNDFIYAEADPGSEEFDGSPSPVHPASPAGEPAATGDTALAELCSSWDSIVATASRPNRLGRPSPQPQPRSTAAKSHVRRHSATDISLQASTAYVPFLQVVPSTPRPRKRDIGLAIALTVGVCVATALVLISGWALSNG
jgi:predicted component of type VI protein secretion system